jgi:hypothetical protein
MDHAVADVLEVRAVFDVGAKFLGGVGNCIVDAFESLPDAGRGASHAPLAQALQFLRARPFSGAVKGQRHLVHGQVGLPSFSIVKRQTPEAPLSPKGNGPQRTPATAGGIEAGSAVGTTLNPRQESRQTVRSNRREGGLYGSKDDGLREQAANHLRDSVAAHIRYEGMARTALPQ